MAITTRQTGLLVSEDWTRLYQTFRNADFRSYDYETLRKSMIDYLKLYYPEDFNDFIESSEFIALVDLIAFLGQSLAFRTDLNARENFIDTAERRDSILKLAKLISYNPKRNIPASGFLKIDSVSTTESVFDSSGLNLAGLVVSWADPANENWLEQFTAIINASLSANQVVGKPSNSQEIHGITNDEYQVNLVPDQLAVVAFQALVEGVQTQFEVVSATSAGQTYIYEAPPRPNSKFNILYRNDNLGNSSNNTGFFVYFKQGSLKTSNFLFSESIPNRVYSVTEDNINNSDVWLYGLSNQGVFTSLWNQVPSTANTNIIYNKSNNKNIYQISSKAGDQIDLIFGDGAFANIPQGNFRLYYRVSNGRQYKVTPDEMQSVIIPINYVSRAGRVETINIRASLKYTVANSSPRESLTEIKQKAPQQYYTQDRMVTGEDYNILPYTLFSNILKIKAVNRTSSGVSRYLDVIDTTGKYSSTNIFAQDGLLYREEFKNTFSFEYTTKNEIYRAIVNQVRPIAALKETLQFFYAFYPKKPLTDVYWHHSTDLANGSTGYFTDLLRYLDASGITGSILQLGDYVGNINRYIKTGAIVKFSPGTGNYFDARNQIRAGSPSQPGDKYYVYAAIEQVINDGTNGGRGDLSNGKGPVTINEVIPTGAIAVEVFSVFNINFSGTLTDTIVSYVQAYEDFGLRYDDETSAWKLIFPQDLSADGAFDLSYAGDTSGQGKDSSWLIKFKTSGQSYTVEYRGLNYVFESEKETNFYFDDTVKVYDPKTGTVINDQIKVLKVNSQANNAQPLAVDYTWYVYKNITESDGYENTSKILITFPDSDSDGIPDNPELFDLIVDPTNNATVKYVYFLDTYGYNNFITKVPVDSTLINSLYSTLRDIQLNVQLYTDGQLFYVSPTNTFYKLAVSGATYTLNEVTGYTAKIGRQKLYFQYRHNSPNYRRIDPSPNNIIDLYILTKQYAADYISWIQDTSNSVQEPEIPTVDSLSTSYGVLENYKSITDTIIYNPAKFKPVFGTKAPLSLQANFKVVKNPNIVISDSDIKTSVIAAINTYFDSSNWDFGETFYFSELSAYLHSVLAPNIASITIVPANETSVFGSLLQINAEYNEIIVSAATVDNVQVISAITAAQLNQTSL